MMISINNRNIEVPQSWNDLSLHQLLSAYGVMMNKFSSFLTEEMLFKRIQLMKVVLNIDDDFLEKWKVELIDLDPELGELQFLEELEILAHKTSTCFFEQVSDNQYQLALTLTKCPWPVLEDFEAEESKYYGPKDGLENLTIYELSMAFMAFERFMIHQNEEDVHQLIAILYRPAKENTKANIRSAYQGDIRLPLLHHEATIEARAKLMQKLPQAVKQVILFWFASCRQAIVKDFENVFFRPDAKQTGNDYAWAGFLIDLAGGVVDLDKVAMQPWDTALTYISMLEDRRKEAELRAKLSK